MRKFSLDMQEIGLWSHAESPRPRLIEEIGGDASDWSSGMADSETGPCLLFPEDEPEREWQPVRTKKMESPKMSFRDYDRKQSQQDRQRRAEMDAERARRQANRPVLPEQEVPGTGRLVENRPLAQDNPFGPLSD